MAILDVLVLRRVLLPGKEEKWKINKVFFNGQDRGHDRPNIFLSTELNNSVVAQTMENLYKKLKMEKEVNGKETGKGEGKGVCRTKQDYEKN